MKKNMKKAAAGLAAIAVAFGMCGYLGEAFPNTQGLFSLTASAEGESDTEFVYEGLKYNVRDDGMYVVTGYTEKPVGELTIPSSINNTAVFEVADGVFKDCTELTHAVINAPVIGESAFEGCTRLTKVEHFGMEGRLSQKAFAGCTNLKEFIYVWFSVGDANIAKNAFEGCPDDIRFAWSSGGGVYAYTEDDGKTLHLYGKGATDSFSGCIWRLRFGDHDKFEKLIVEDGVTCIGHIAFAEFTNLKEVILPDSVTDICDGAFAGTPWLDEQIKKDPLVIYKNTVIDMGSCSGDVVIPDGIEHICGCSTPNVKSVTIPASVMEISNGSVASSYAFAKAEDLTIKGYTGSAAEAFAKAHDFKFESLGEAPEVPAEKYVNYEIEGNSAVITGKKYSLIPENYEIPSTLEGMPVTEIAMSAFSNCQFKSVTIPNTVKKIGESAFNLCGELTEVTIPKSVTQIDQFAFRDCRSLKEVTILNPKCEIFDDGGTICQEIKWEWNDDNESSKEVISFDGVIKGYEGSTAQAFAEKYGYTFEALPDIPGDISGDGVVNVSDISMLAAQVKGLKIMSDTSAADLNGDGTVNVSDISLLAAHVKGIKTLV